MQKHTVYWLMASQATEAVYRKWTALAAAAIDTTEVTFFLLNGWPYTVHVCIKIKLTYM